MAFEDRKSTRNYSRTTYDFSLGGTVLKLLPWLCFAAAGYIYLAPMIEGSLGYCNKNISNCEARTF